MCRPCPSVRGCLLCGVGVAVVALKSGVDDRDVMVALRGTSGIGEGPRAAGTAESIFCERMFPKQSSFRFMHARSVLYMRLRMCLV
jgi:hypothetical protein